VTFRGVVELIRDGAWAQDGWTQGRKPRIRDDLTVLGHATNAWHEARRQEAVGLSNDAGARSRRAIELVNPSAGAIELAAGQFDAQAAADEWRAALGRNRAAAGPQGRTACGPVDDNGYCRSGSHSMSCAESMSSAASKATFAVPGSRDADQRWRAAKIEREGQAAMTRAPGVELRAAKAREAAAEREERLARGRMGGSWVTSGRNPEWMTRGA
jgi:hypothetical protein